MSQRTLEFGAAEGSFREREATLANAILRSRVSVAGMSFVRRVFQLTNGGLRPYVASYEAMTSDAWCLPGKTTDAARKIVRETIKLGLIAREQQRYVDRGQRPNAYRIDWPAVTRLATGIASLRGPEPSHDGPSPPGLYDHPGGHHGHPGGHHGHPGGHHGHPGGHHGHPFKEDTSSCLVPPSSYPSGPEGLDRSGDDRLFADLPELAQLRSQPVTPLPRSLRLRADPFAALKESDLANLSQMTMWFRYCADEFSPNQAELVLILASVRRAASMRADEIQTTRVRVFAGIVRRRAWHRVRKFIPDVIEWLGTSAAARPLTYSPETVPSHEGHENARTP